MWHSLAMSSIVTDDMPYVPIRALALERIVSVKFDINILLYFEIACKVTKKTPKTRKVFKVFVVQMSVI